MQDFKRFARWFVTSSQCFLEHWSECCMCFKCTSINSGLSFWKLEQKQISGFFFWLILVSGIICVCVCPGSSRLGFDVWLRWLMWQFARSTGVEGCPSCLYLWAWEWTPVVSVNLFRHSLRLSKSCTVPQSRRKAAAKIAVEAVGSHSRRIRNDTCQMERALRSERTSVSLTNLLCCEVTWASLADSCNCFSDST